MTAINYNLKKREKKRNDKHIDKVSYLTHKFNNNHRNQQQYQVDHQSKVFISNHTLHYAVEEHRPPINVKSEPKLTDQKHATTLIKELFKLVVP